MSRMINPFNQDSHSKAVPSDLALFRFLAVLIATGTTASSIVSAKISVKGEALLLPQSCGEPNYDYERFRYTSAASFRNLQLDDFQALFLIAGYSTDRSLAYSRDCYFTTNISSNACNTLVKSKLDCTMTLDAPCPFGNNLCLSPAVSITSPLIDTLEHLGINTRPSERVSGQKVLTCAPIDIEKYSTDWIETSIPVGIPWDKHYINALVKRYNLGPQTIYDPDANYSAQITNLTLLDSDQYASPYSVL